MGIATGKGDDGFTHLPGGGRVPKTHPRIILLGSLDELSSQLGAACSFSSFPETNDLLRSIQKDLHHLAAAVSGAVKPDSFADRKESIEERIAELEKSLPPLKKFILPGGPPCAALLHVARAVCRRAERETGALDEVTTALVVWLNRLSDLLFLVARRETLAAGREEESV